MPLFMSDNVTSACPDVMEAVIAANSGSASAYGEDRWSAELQEKLSEIFETKLAAFPVVTGTASNALALSTLTPPFGKIYCHELAHINTDECGAPEFFSAGAKLIPMKGKNGKITADALASTIYGAGNVHHAQPAVVSITQSCETGGVYQIDEIKAIAKVAKDNGLHFHMDGARFANSLASLNVAPAEITWKSGVEVLSFGGTKNGCLAAEVVVFFKPELAINFPYLHKRSGQLLSKMRFVSSQLIAYLSNDIWLRNAEHANEMAARLSAGLSKIPGIELAYPTQSNEVFVYLSDIVVNGLKKEGYEVNEDELDGTAARFVAAWDTDPKDIDALIKAASKYA